MEFIKLTTIGGDKFIRINPQAIEAIFEGRGEYEFVKEVKFHGATIFLSCGHEVDLLESPEDIELKIKDNDCTKN